jgi:hypothetical protein
VKASAIPIALCLVVAATVGCRTGTASRPDRRPPALCKEGDCRAAVGALDGFLFTRPCGDAGRGFDCTQESCGTGASTEERTFVVKGDPGQIYEIDLTVRGIVEAKNYAGGRRRAPALDPSDRGGDAWYEGGTVPGSHYNTYELHVTPPVPGAPNDYYLNAGDGSPEGHMSWALDYRAAIRAAGGATLAFRSFDSNCHQIMNCGPGVGSPATGCRAPRVLDLADAVPPPPATFAQPPRNAQGAPGQWLFIDVTAVKAL